MISSFLFLFAGILNAVMDVLQFHFRDSIFYTWAYEKHKMDFTWWWPEYSHDNKYNDNGSRRMLFWKIPYPVALTDAWHFSKSLMLICICLGTAVCFDSSIIDLTISFVFSYNFWLYLAIKFIWLRACFGLGFVTFYNYILKK